jgi:hypothetical protein
MHDLREGKVKWDNSQCFGVRHLSSNLGVGGANDKCYNYCVTAC